MNYDNSNKLHLKKPLMANKLKYQPPVIEELKVSIEVLSGDSSQILESLGGIYGS